MKILLINVAINCGSTGRIVEGIGNMAKSKGWDVYVAHGARYVNKSTLNNYQITNKLGEVFHYIRSLFFDAQGLGSRSATKRFLFYIDKIRPDIVHIHNIHGSYLNYPCLFKYLRNRRIPVIWTLHDCWPITGHCVYFEKIKCHKWEEQCSACPQKKDYPVSILWDGSKRNFNYKKGFFTSMEKMYVTTVSSWLKGLVEQSFLKKYPIYVIHNGIDTSSFCFNNSDIRDRFHIEGKKLILAVATGFERRKGIHDFIKLSKILPTFYQLMLVGTSESDRKALPDNIISVPKTKDLAELSAFYSAADALLSLSYEETFGLTIIEAMACGTPVIVYDNTAQPELITPVTGRIVPTGDIEGVKRAIEEICSNGREHFAHACREHALDYDERKVYQKYMDLYVQVH